MYQINDFEKVGNNLYKKDKKYFRLFGKGITPNSCWVISPKMVRLLDIDIQSGNDRWGKEEIKFDVTGSVQNGPEYIYY